MAGSTSRVSGGASLPSPSAPDAGKRTVSYFYDPDIGDYFYSERHFMRPQRIRMTHDLVLNYGLHEKMEIRRPFAAAVEDMTKFHSEEYVNFLASCSDPQTRLQAASYGCGDDDRPQDADCPIFDGLFDYCRASAGGSIGAAYHLNFGKADIAINWAGGLHHAKKDKASGFCYVNDIVLGILELLKYHQRVLYIDIDVHHGDGVEEAFYTTPRVMTLSFHKYDGIFFFPMTGNISANGLGQGKNYSLNIPLNNEMNDDCFLDLFKPIVAKVMEFYNPGAVVLQCGADSLTGDKIGTFNLSLKGHGGCLRFLRSYNVPLMVLGGGGYTIPNVARCWCYETAIAVGIEPDNSLPYCQYYEYFGPKYNLHIQPSKRKVVNTRTELDEIRSKIFDYLSEIEHVPSVQFHDRLPDVDPPHEEVSDA